MKKTSINHCLRPGDKASIYTKRKQSAVSLGNGTVIRSSNIKNTKAALAETNRQLNAITDEINFLYMEAFIEYRRLWRSFAPVEGQQLHQLIFDINRKISSAVDRTETPNANYFVFKHLDNALSMIIGMIERVQLVQVKLNRWPEKRFTTAMINRAFMIKNNLQNLGTNGTEPQLHP